MKQTKLVAVAGLATAVFASAPAAGGQEPAPQGEIQQLKREIEAQRKQLESQQKRLEQLEMQAITGRGTPPDPSAVAQPGQAAPTQVGKPPDTSRPPEVPALTDIRGVLTPRNTIIFEPSLQYSHSTSNRVALLGFTIIPAITIGLIDIRSVRRDTFIGAVAARYGVTNRFEVEAKVPYVYRHDATLSRQIGAPAVTDTVFNASGDGMGDIEFAARYQINQPGPDRPYYVAGLRFKSRTGKDPFDVETDAITGLQRQLPTGSGFYGVQPSLTAIFPSDPAVFFGNVNYLWNIKRDVGRGIGEVDPGDSVGFTVGMGLALNEKASFSIGYDHATVFKTKQNRVLIPNSTVVQLGTVLFGLSYRLTPKTTVNFTLGAGLTEEAPNVQLNFRLPMTL